MESSSSTEAANIRSAAPAWARSYLFVPATRPERIAKALASGADAVIVDLEDAVAPDAKDAARAALANVLDPAQPVIVRINAPNTRWFEEDLRLCKSPGVGAIMLPKAEGWTEVRAKLCIHPQQVKWVNESFTPSLEETAWAKRVIAAAQAAQGGVVAVDGKMVDRPVLALAERILARGRVGQ
jgi:citrate lyase beta subunit